MAERLRKRHQDDVRQKIRASIIINGLQRFFITGEVREKAEGEAGIAGDEKSGTLGKWRKPSPAEAPIIALRMKAGLALLAKVLPDLQSIQMQAELTERFVARTPEVEKTTEQWQEKYAPQMVQ